jgi:hypothetical protein
MKLAKNIRVKKFPWTVLPIISTYTAHAIYPNIYVPRHIYDDLKSKNPEPRNVATLIHEQTHIDRQKKDGWFIWGLKYCLVASFRLDEELQAIKASMKYMKQKKQTWDTARTAKFLSSYLYLWCVSYEKAKYLLDDTWNRAKR